MKKSCDELFDELKSRKKVFSLVNKSLAEGQEKLQLKVVELESIERTSQELEEKEKHFHAKYYNSFFGPSFDRFQLHHF